MTFRPEAWAANFYLVTVMVVIEALGAGMGTAAFMVFIQRTTKPSFKATTTAISTSIMSISATWPACFGPAGGGLGWPLYFGFTFLATLPGMACTCDLPHPDGTSAADPRRGANSDDSAGGDIRTPIE